MKMNSITYSIVVPLYNEEAVVAETYSRLKKVMDSTAETYELIFVNDGSKDSTRKKVEAICKIDSNVKLLDFSRNFGHQSAITAGMEYSTGAAVVVIDADLQDPPEVILQMIKKWKAGYKVVYGKRAKREGETIFKTFTAKVYYRLLSSMTSVDIPVDTGDFRLIDRVVCNVLTSLPEKNRYVRGLVSWVGYEQTSVEYVRKERYAGESKYPLKKMIKLALDGITSFSSKPLIIPGFLGLILSTLGIFSSVWIFLSNLIQKHAILNLGLLLGIILTLFGLLFLSVGMVGQYLGRVFDESKNRPLYILEDVINYQPQETKEKLNVSGR